jgi:hypothetical protein
LALTTNRRFLDRAVALGFRELCFYGRDRPVLCDDGRRHYLWGVLDPKDVIRPDDQALRVESEASPGTNSPSATSQSNTTTTSRRTNEPMKTNKANDQVAEPGRRQRKAGRSASTAEGDGQQSAMSPIQQAELLYASLRDSLQLTRGLVVALRRQKKQSRLVETTLASLKQLQAVAE